VVGVDGSPPSVEALTWAARQAALTGGPLDVLMTWHLPVGDPLASIDDDDYLLVDAERVLAQTITSALGDSPGIEYCEADEPAGVALGVAQVVQPSDNLELPFGSTAPSSKISLANFTALSSASSSLTRRRAARSGFAS
jgi:hypothetical protein